MFTAPLRVLGALIFLFSLTGSQCAFFAWSGNWSADDEDDEDDNAGLIIVIRDGRFVDAPVEGLHYTSGVVSGFTGADGEFRYQSDSTVSFAIGDVVLGKASGAQVIAPFDLVPGSDIDTPAVINIARLLLSLDATPGDTLITIPEAMHHEAVRSNAALSGVIEFLDFHDDTAFVNAASQLIAVLTRNYPFTAVLVDGETARDHLQNTVDSLP